MTGYIYALWDKHENDIFYIGSSTNPECRAFIHKSSFRCKLKSGIDLPNKDRQFNYSIIDEIEIGEYGEEKPIEYFALEIYWIHQFKAWGFNLLNRQFYRKKHLLLSREAANRPKYMKDIEEYVTKFPKNILKLNL